MFIEYIFTQQNTNFNLFIENEKYTKFKEFEVSWNQMDINGYTFIVPVLYLSEEEIKYKGMKFITIATLNGDISTKLKKVYKVLEDFYIQFSDILCPLVTLWNIKMNSSLEQQLLNEYNLLRNDYLRNKWKTDVYKKYSSLKLQQIYGKMLSSAEVWNIIDLYWIEQMKVTHSTSPQLIEEKKESTNIQDKIKREDLNNEGRVTGNELCSKALALVPRVPLEDELSEQLIAQMMEEMIFEDESINQYNNEDEEKYSRPLEEHKVMKLIDDEVERRVVENAVPYNELESRKRILCHKTVAELRIICKNNDIHPIPKLKNDIINSIAVRFGIQLEQ